MKRLASVTVPKGTRANIRPQMVAVPIRPVRVTRKRALRLVKNPAADAEQLLSAARFYPRRVLEHPVFALLVVADTPSWQAIKVSAEGRLLRSAWGRVNSRLRAGQRRRLAVAALRRAAPILDRALSLPGQPLSFDTGRLAHMLEGALDKQLDLRDMIGFSAAAEARGEGVREVESTDELHIAESAYALRLVSGACEVVLRPRRTKLAFRSNSLPSGARVSWPRRPEKLLEMFPRLWSIREPLAELEAWRWQVAAGRALLAGKPTPP